MTERQPYDVVREYDGFEVRRYPAHMLVQVDTAGGIAQAASSGFAPLFQYISGGNAARQSIAMTAPVIQQSDSAGGQTVSFVLPAGMDPASAPAPTDSRVRTTAVLPRLVAASRFSGITRTERFTRRGERLLAAVRAAGLEPVGAVSYARFDPPWTPGPLRHNEAQVELAASTGAPLAAPTGAG